MSTIPRQNITRLMGWFFLGAALVVMPGCNAWNNWLDFLKWKTPPAAGAGPPPPPLRPMTDLYPPNALIPQVAVYRLTLPVGAFSNNDKVWAQLNEDAVDSKTAVLMAQNGLRAGTGVVSRWSAILKQLDLPDNAVEERIYQTDGRSSINVPTRPGVDYEIVFSVDQDQTLKGREFYACDNSFRLTMAGVRGKPQLQVQLEPVVTLGTVSVVRGPSAMGVVRSGFTSEESFTDLRMAALLTADQFLVVCAMDPKGSEHSVGTLWLSNPVDSPATESVLVFVPAGAGPRAAK